MYMVLYDYMIVIYVYIACFFVCSGSLMFSGNLRFDYPEVLAPPKHSKKKTETWEIKEINNNDRKQQILLDHR
jgi:hypothetical protein